MSPPHPRSTWKTPRSFSRDTLFKSKGLGTQTQRLEKKETTKKLSACFPTRSSRDRVRAGSAWTGTPAGLREGKRARLPCAASSKDPYLPAAAQFLLVGRGTAPTGEAEEPGGGGRTPSPSGASPGPPRPGGGREGGAGMPAGWRRLEKGPLPS